MKFFSILEYIIQNLTGHNAPVTLLKLDPLGKTLLSGDIEGRDRSMRLWDLTSGKLSNNCSFKLNSYHLLF